MNYKTLRISLQIIGSVVALAWFLESQIQGRGFISTYLAPFAFGPLVIASVMLFIECRSAKTRDHKLDSHHDNLPPK